MALDPQVRQALDLLASLPPAAGHVEARARYERVSMLLVAGAPPDPVASVRDADADGVPVRVYEPGGARGTLVFLHGGGWVIGSLDSHDAVCRSLAARSGVAVVSVGYRLAPEHPFPAAVEDGERALRWAARTVRGPLAVGGDSAGGNLATVLARRARDLDLAFQLLFYPVIDAGARADVDEECAFTRAEMDAFWALYAPRGDAGGLTGDPDASPAAARDLDGVAPALLVLADCDPLREEAEAYAARLPQATVEVVPGTAHGFVRWTALAAVAQAALNRAAAALRAALDGR